jgi:ribosomal protein L44E
MKISIWLLKRLMQWLSYPHFRILAYYYQIDPTTYRGSLFEPLLMSTANINLKIPGISEVLAKIDHIDNFEPTDIIPRIASNFCSAICPKYDVEFINKEKSNRGRKPKADKKKKKRKKQGTGSEFNSQMTFDVKSPEIEKKYFKVKIFRKGSIQIPGCLALEDSHIHPILSILSKYLMSYMPDQPIDLTQYDSRSIGMVNHGADLSCRPEIRIRNPCECGSKKSYKECSCPANYDYLIDEYKLGELINGDIEEKKRMGIRDVIFVTLKGNYTKLKLSRPTATNEGRDTTVKITSTKVAFDGGVSFEDTKATYWWLNDYIIKHFDEVMIYRNSTRYLHKKRKIREIVNMNQYPTGDWGGSDSSDTEDEIYQEAEAEVETTEDWLNKQ